jgi:RimJ/RimL family protein N-acetyltransferase
MAYASLPKERISGRSIDLRPADMTDAEFVLKLRLDPQLNTHLSATAPAIAPQREWIRRCKDDPAQCYFIIQDKQGQPVGTIRIYDLQPDSFCWGSWILQPGAPRKAAIESALLVYEFAFYRLGFTRCHFDVRKQNTRVLDFHQRFGAKIVGETADDFFFHFFKADYEATREKYRAFLP